MSDTPRTDEANKQYQVDVYDNPKGFCVTEPVHASFARKLEREIRQLEVTIYDLKTENNLLHEALDQVIEDRDSYHEENNGLLKDKERLDWLIDHAYIQFYKVDDGGEWEMELDASNARNHIDKEMQDYKA